MPGTTRVRKPYLSIIDGVFKEKVDKDTPGAVRRDYETPAGDKGTKYELEYDTWSGIVLSLVVRDTPYGDVFNMEFEDAVLSINTSHRMFNSIMEKLPNADLTKEITLKPYDFKDDHDKRVSGVNIFQGDMNDPASKLASYYVERVEKTDEKTGKKFNAYQYVKGYPEPDPNAPKNKNYWKKHFLNVQDFFVAAVIELNDEIQNGSKSVQNDPGADKPESAEKPTFGIDDELDEVKIEDVPF